MVDSSQFPIQKRLRQICAKSADRETAKLCAKICGPKAVQKIGLNLASNLAQNPSPNSFRFRLDSWDFLIELAWHMLIHIVLWGSGIEFRFVSRKCPHRPRNPEKFKDECLKTDFRATRVAPWNHPDTHTHTQTEPRAGTRADRLHPKTCHYTQIPFVPKLPLARIYYENNSLRIIFRNFWGILYSRTVQERKTFSRNYAWDS